MRYDFCTTQYASANGKARVSGAQLNGTKTLIAYFFRVLFHKIYGEIPVLKRKFERYLTDVLNGEHVA